MNIVTEPTEIEQNFYVDYIKVNAQSYYTHIFDDGIFKTKVAGLQMKVICYSKRVK